MKEEDIREKLDKMAIIPTRKPRDRFSYCTDDLACLHTDVQKTRNYGDQKKAGVAILISDKIDFQIKETQKGYINVNPITAN